MGNPVSSEEIQPYFGSRLARLDAMAEFDETILDDDEASHIKSARRRRQRTRKQQEEEDPDFVIYVEVDEDSKSKDKESDKRSTKGISSEQVELIETEEKDVLEPLNLHVDCDSEKQNTEDSKKQVTLKDSKEEDISEFHPINPTTESENEKQIVEGDGKKQVRLKETTEDDTLELQTLNPTVSLLSDKQTREKDNKKQGKRKLTRVKTDTSKPQNQTESLKNDKTVSGDSQSQRRVRLKDKDMNRGDSLELKPLNTQRSGDIIEKHDKYDKPNDVAFSDTNEEHCLQKTESAESTEAAQDEKKLFDTSLLKEPAFQVILFVTFAAINAFGVNVNFLPAMAHDKGEKK